MQTPLCEEVPVLRYANRQWLEKCRQYRSGQKCQIDCLYNGTFSGTAPICGSNGE